MKSHSFSDIRDCPNCFCPQSSFVAFEWLQPMDRMDGRPEKTTNEL